MERDLKPGTSVSKVLYGLHFSFHSDARRHRDPNHCLCREVLYLPDFTEASILIFGEQSGCRKRRSRKEHHHVLGMEQQGEGEGTGWEKERDWPPTPAPRAQRDRISEAPRKRQATPLLSIQIHILVE